MFEKTCLKCLKKRFEIWKKQFYGVLVLFFSKFMVSKAAFHATESIYLIYNPKKTKSIQGISHKSTYLATASTLFTEQNTLLFSAVHPKGSTYRFLYILLKFIIRNVVKKFGKISHLHPKIPDI